MLAVYKKGGFKITNIHCDNEFREVIDPFPEKQDPKIKMNYAEAQEHVPQSERNKRVIKERVRAACHIFPLTNMPHILVKYLVMESNKNLNFFPNKHGVSKYFSLFIIIHKEKLDYECH